MSLEDKLIALANGIDSQLSPTENLKMRINAGNTLESFRAARTSNASLTLEQFLQSSSNNSAMSNVGASVLTLSPILILGGIGLLILILRR